MLTDYTLSSVFPPVPADLPGAEYRTRTIPNSGVYKTTGVFDKTAKDATAPNVLWSGDIFFDSDLVDFFYHGNHEKQAGILAKMDEAVKKRGSPFSSTELKSKMYLNAASNPTGFEAIRKAHLECIQDILAKLDIVPTIITDSGWGHHVHCWLTDGQGYAVDISKMTETMKAIGAIANAHLGFELFDTGVHDAGSRILRELNTQNTKCAEQSKTVTITVCNPDARFNLNEYVTPQLTASPTYVAPVATAGAKIVETAASRVAYPDFVITAEPNLSEDVDLLLLNNPKLKKLWKNVGKTSGDTSGSGYDASVATFLAGEGVCYENVARAIKHRPGREKLGDREACRVARFAMEAVNRPVTAKIPTGSTAFALNLPLALDEKGNILCHSGNITLIIRQDPLLAGKIWLDESTMFPHIHPDVRATFDLPPTYRNVLTDADEFAIQNWIIATYGIIPGIKMVQAAIHLVAAGNVRSKPRDYLNALPVWDGTKRVESWLTTAAGVEDNVLTRAYAKKYLLSCVARAMNPGCQVDTVLVLVGPQGAQKSTLLRELAGTDLFADSELDIQNKDSYGKIRTAWIYEIAEMSSFNKAETNLLKAFVSSREDTYRPPYGHCTVTSPRSMCFAATSNNNDFLKDVTGSRRFWCVTVTTINLDWMRANRDQLWAEAMYLYLGATKTNTDHIWWLTPAEDSIRVDDAAEYASDDPYVDLCLAWLQSRPSNTFSLVDCIKDIEILGNASYHQANITAAMKKIGCEKKMVREGGTQKRVWVAPPTITCTAPSVDFDLIPMDLPVEDSTDRRSILQTLLRDGIISQEAFNNEFEN